MRTTFAEDEPTCSHGEPEGQCAACHNAARMRAAVPPRTINRADVGKGGAVIETRGSKGRPVRLHNTNTFGGHVGMRDLHAGQDRIARRDRLAGDSVRQHGLTSKGVGPAAKAIRARISP